MSDSMPFSLVRMGKTLWKELVRYAYKHNLPCRGFSDHEIFSMVKTNGISEEEEQKLRRIASSHGSKWRFYCVLRGK